MVNNRTAESAASGEIGSASYESQLRGKTRNCCSRSRARCICSRACCAEPRLDRRVAAADSGVGDVYFRLSAEAIALLRSVLIGTKRYHKQGRYPRQKSCVEASLYSARSYRHKERDGLHFAPHSRVEADAELCHSL